MGNKAFLAINPSAGQSDHQAVSQYILAKCAQHNWECSKYLTVGDHSDYEKMRSIAEGDYDLVFAAGGDGTIAMVADALVETDIPMAIIPIGTGNGAARFLEIPLDWRRAVDLVFDRHATNLLDAMYVEGKHFMLHLGVGLSGVALRKTDRQSKRFLGRLYYPFEGLKALLGYQPHRFEIIIDGKKFEYKGAEIFVVNSPSMGDPFVNWSDTIQPTDGILDVFIVRARTFLDYFRLAWNTILGRQMLDPKVTYYQARDEIHIRSFPPLPMQADGDYLTTTPLTVKIKPAAVRIIGSDHLGHSKEQDNTNGQ
jgi:YegS/Rv2252/BmrU family lipid kinase